MSEKKNCIFCKIINGELPSYKVYEDEHTMVIMDIAKDVDGHMIAITKKHIKNILDCDVNNLNHLMSTVKKVANHCVSECGYDGVNLLNASDESAGQSVPHFHIHIIPRRQNDSVDAWPQFEGAKCETEEIYEKIRMNCVSEEIRLETERLTLLPHGTKYLETTHEYASDIEVTRYMMALPSDSYEATRKFLENCEAEWKKEQPAFYEFAIIKDEIQIGSIGLYLNDNYDTAELGWILARNSQNFGYATEAVTAVIKYAQEKLGLKHFIAHCDSENTASENVMKKIGMTKVSCHGGRKNKSSDEERNEYLYEMWM